MAQAHKGFYSIIQYMPDPGRMEIINVGIMLLVPDLCFLAVRMDETNDRVQHTFPQVDIERIDAAKQALCFRLHQLGPTVNQLQNYADSLANALRMTIIRPIRVEGDPEKCLQILLDDLVR